jgi:hypothetical protein
MVFLSNFLVVSFSGFPGNAEAWNTLLPTEVKGLPGNYVDGIELIFRLQGQFPQLEACVFESGNTSPPKRRSIGEFLEEVIFAVHDSPCGARLFLSAILDTGKWVVKFIVHIE